MSAAPQNYPTLYDITKYYSNSPADLITTTAKFSAIPFKSSTGVGVDAALGLIKNTFHLENQYNFYATT